MYFTNKSHYENYELLMSKYDEGVQYEASIYIAAVPEIFNAIDLSKLDSSSPLFALTSWNDVEEKHEFTAAQLTGATRRMCELGLSLYNGYSANLDEILSSVIDEKMVRVLFQAMKIRTVNFRYETV
ncbi:DUF2538 family protein [Fictibacillus sp. 23RED33]|uniref:DUF2538 family protein n=1 Tax=Fictibacillus sp. 23RED33 TaxID=2745879 RepID=UPI0018CCA56D|nr:DUF2538 family protein [Fictibacillus sp. 23RED33]MBH0175872.1 DUF2538 family protein [Fictibacillus sp. 23RED33]